jgi:type IV pilus assembly protein PilA
MTSLNPSLRLALLQKAKGKKNILQKGFTLVELMVVIVVVGVLSAVALPQFLGVKDRAALAASIGENVGLAKECSALQLIGGPFTTDCTEATGFNWESLPATTNSAGVACGPELDDDANKVAATKKCTIKVEAGTGKITYTVG